MLTYGAAVLSNTELIAILLRTGTASDNVLQVAEQVLMTCGGLAGLMIYLLVRPRETLSEAYERSLEEEALLQEIEDKPTCPGCGQRVQDNWQACPHCFTRLKKPCTNCRQMLDLSWQVCPYCTAQQRTAAEPVIATPSYVRPSNIPEQTPAGTQAQPQVRRRTAARNVEPLEFVEGDDL